MEIREVERPTAGEGEIVVEVRAALTCGTDRKILERGHPKFSPPLVMGHEFSGDVVEAGEGAPFRVGDAVMCGTSGSCGNCTACRDGARNRCESPTREIAWGAFARLVRVPRRVVAENVYLKPADLSYEAAAFLDPLACVARGFARLGLRKSDHLLVVGTGPIGLLWIAAAAHAGLERISALGKGESRLSLARQWGAEVYDLSRHERPPAAPRVVECVGTPAAWAEAFALTSPGGSVLFFGGCAPGTSVALDAGRFHYEEITALGSFHYRPEEADCARRWLASRVVDPTPLVSGEGNLDDLSSFLARMRAGEGFKYVVRP
jgi:L-iditol 2-dehydrogenase